MRSECRSCTSVLLSLLLIVPLIAATRGKDVMYSGGTISQIPENTKGTLDLADDKAAVFALKRGERLTIPYSGITSLEYGQKAGRRVGAALAVNPAFLLSKKRRHYLTVTFKDSSGAGQSAVFELSKGTVQSVVTTLETRSGKKTEFESDEAKKHFEKGGK